MAKTRPIPQRDTTLHSADEMKRRLAFVLYALSAPAGLLALIAFFVKKQPLPAVAGGVLLGLFIGLHFTRRRWGAKQLADEIAKNPFKPKRAPKDPGEGLLG